MFNKKKPRRLVLHIGDPKTGSTSIQKAISLARVTSDAGRVSGFLTEASSANAVTLARSLTVKGKPKRRATMQEVRRWLKSQDAEISIISSEFFAKSDPQIVHDVFFRRYPELVKSIKVIGYARPHLGRTLSAFTEEVRNGFTLQDFMPWFNSSVKAQKLLCYPRFRRWHDVYGDGLTVRPFMRGELAEGDVVEDFFRIVFEDKPFSVQKAPEENPSISLKALSGLLAFNRRMAAMDVPPKWRIPLARTIHKALSHNPDLEKPKLDKQSAELIVKTYAKDSKEMDDFFFKKPLFAKDLHADKSDLPDEKINLSFSNYYTIEAQAVIDRHTREVERLVPAEIQTWHLHYLHNRQQQNLGKPIAETGGGDLQKRLLELAACFS